jgi:acetolactate synthase-1/3 small subunit
MLPSQFPATTDKSSIVTAVLSPLTAKKKKDKVMLAVRARIASRALSATRAFTSTVRILSDEPPKPPRPIDDSTSALDYKNSHKVKPPPLPKMDLPRSRSAEEAVTNILYNTPPPSLQPFKK